MIYAIIVTYNPDLQLLEKQFHALHLQVDGLISIDIIQKSRRIRKKADYSGMWNQCT